MTELSPAQKALAALNERHELCGPFDDDWVEQYKALPLTKKVEIRSELLAIAAELRGTTTTETQQQ